MIAKIFAILTALVGFSHGAIIVMRSPWWQRQKAKWRLWQSLGDMINRRVSVEVALRDVAAGKRDLLTRAECLELARRLGEPS